MGVIRKESSAAAKSFSFTDLERQGRELLARAEMRAQQMIRDAQAQIRATAEARQQAGYEQGLAEGRQAGLAQIREEAREAAHQAAREELAHLLGALGNGLEEFERQRRSLLALAESGLIELAVAIARRVCKMCAAASPDAARANARALLELVQHQGDLELHVHPDEHELLGDVAGEFAAATAHLGHVTLVPDPAVARGGCVLQTKDGAIDATIDGQIERVAAAISAAHVSGPAGSVGELSS